MGLYIDLKRQAILCPLKDPRTSPPAHGTRVFFITNLDNEIHTGIYQMTVSGGVFRMGFTGYTFAVEDILLYAEKPAQFNPNDSFIIIHLPV